MPGDPYNALLHPHLAQTQLSSSLAHVCPCTHKRLQLYMAAVCLKCCFYIAAIFHFGLLSLNCLWGFVWGEEPSHLYMRLKERKEAWRLAYVLIHFPHLFFFYACPHTTIPLLCFIPPLLLYFAPLEPSTPLRLPARFRSPQVRI